MRSEEEMISAIDKYADMVKKICFVHMKQDSDVDDIFQNVFLKYAKTTSFMSEEHEKAWLIRVTINCCKDSLNTWFRRKVVLDNELETYYQQNEFYKHTELYDIVLKLPKNYKNVIYLYYYEEYKIKEIADILNRKENTIHTWLKRARSLLKEQLGGDDFE